jgi:hypothetical protein
MMTDKIKEDGIVGNSQPHAPREEGGIVGVPAGGLGTADNPVVIGGPKPVPLPSLDEVAVGLKEAFEECFEVKIVEDKLPEDYSSPSSVKGWWCNFEHPHGFHAMAKQSSLAWGFRKGLEVRKLSLSNLEYIEDPGKLPILRYLVIIDKTREEFESCPECSESAYAGWKPPVEDK